MFNYRAKEKLEKYTQNSGTISNCLMSKFKNSVIFINKRIKNIHEHFNGC